MSRLTLALLSILALLLTACPADEPVDDPPEDPVEDPVDEDRAPPVDDEATWNTCTNTAGGYTVEYPADWHANTANHLDECQVFDPEPVELPDQPRDLPLDFGVIMRVEPIDFADLTAEDIAADIVAEEDTEVDGHTAVRQEVVATGEGLHPEGTQHTSWAVDRNGETIVAEAYDVGEPDYERKVEVLDQMMTTLRFDENL